MSTTLGPKIAVIAGGGGGIGQAVVLRLATSGFSPVILDKTTQAGEHTLSKLDRAGQRGEFILADLTKHEDVQHAFSQVLSNYGRVDVLVNLAGGTFHKKLIQNLTIKEWMEVIDMNLKATFLCCQSVIKSMKRQESGSIINTASNFGITGSPGRTHYSAAKAAVIAFSKSLALELATNGIRVNTIAPGMTATERVRSKFTEEEWAEEGKKIPMRRTAEPCEIAEGVAFLASPESGYMTGQTVHVNGGMVMP